MMSEKFQIRADRRRSLVTITWTTPYWDSATFDDLKLRLNEKLFGLDRAVSESLVLVDARNASVQSQEVFDKIKYITEYSKELRIAYVVNTALLRLQIKRVGLRENVRIFGVVDEAEKWLLSGSDH